METTIRVGLKLETLDVDQSPFPTREVQPPLIYTRGDGRLNNNIQSQNQSTNLYTLSPSLVFLLLVRRCSLQRRASIYEALGAGEPT